MKSHSQPEKCFLSIHWDTDQVRSRGIHKCSFGHKIVESGRLTDGIFAEWEWDGETLTVRNDRYGIYPLYYFATRNGICLSPSLITLLQQGAPTEVDDAAMAAFIRIGFFLGNDTPFAAIRALPPSAELTWSRGVLLLRSEIPIARPQKASRDEVIDRYIELFRLAIGRRPPTSDCVVPLSGGRDSRHIVCELHSQGYTPKFCATMRYPPPWSSEDETASALCRTLGIPHRIYGPAHISTKLEFKKNLETNLSTFEHAWAQALYDEIRGEATSLYDGAAGDVFSAAHFNTPERIQLFESGRLREFAKEMLHNEGAIKLLIAPAKYRRMNPDMASHRILQELERHTKAPNPVASFFFFNRTRRVAAIVPYTIMRDVEYAYLPFVDHDVFDFLMGFPGQMFIDYKLHTDAIKRAYPNSAEVPFVSKRQLPGGQKYFRRFAGEILRMVLSKDSQWVARSRLIPRLFRCMIDSSYSTAVTEWLSFIPIYLYQLESILRGDQFLIDDQRS